MEKLSHAVLLSGSYSCTIFQENMILIIFTNHHYHPYCFLCTSVCLWTIYIGTREPSNLLTQLLVFGGGSGGGILFYYVCILISTKIHLGTEKSRSNIIIYVFFGQLLPNYSIPCDIVCPLLYNLYR